MDIPEPSIGITTPQAPESVKVTPGEKGIPDEMFFSPHTILPPPPEDVIITPHVRRPHLRTVIDESLILSREQIKENLRSTADIVRAIEPAPATKKAIKRKEREMAGTSALFHAPIMEGLAPELLHLFTRNMVTAEPVLEPRPILEPTTPPTSPPIFFDEPPITGGEDIVEPGIGEVTEPPLISEKEIFTPTPGKEPTIESWSERTRKMHKFLDKTFYEERVDQLHYFDMIQDKRRKVVVGTFFELLVLKSRGIIDVHQEAPYSDIIITKTEEFDRVHTVLEEEDQ